MMSRPLLRGRAPRSALVLACLWAVGCGDDGTAAAPAAPNKSAAPRTAASPAVSAAPPASAAASAPATSTAPSGAPAASGAPGASASPAASGAPSASAGPAASGSGAPAAGPAPIAFVDFSGPVTKPTVKVGEPVWAVVPVSGSWEAVKLSLLSALAVDDKAVVVEQAGRQYLVPAALAAPVNTAALAKGDLVLASAHGSRAYGRVLDVQGEVVKVRTKFAGTIETNDLSPRDVLKLDGSASFGAPALVKDKNQLRPAVLIHASPGRSWVVQAGGRPRGLPTAEVEVLPAPKLHAVGDAVLAARLDRMATGVIAKVLEDGLLYEVKWEGSDETTTQTFELVTTAKR